MGEDVRKLELKFLFGRTSLSLYSMYHAALPQLTPEHSLEMYQETRPARKEQAEHHVPLTTSVPQSSQVTAHRSPHPQDTGFWDPGQ